MGVSRLPDADLDLSVLSFGSLRLEPGATVRVAWAFRIQENFTVSSR